MKRRITRRRVLAALGITLLPVILGGAWLYHAMFSVPGSSFAGALDPLTPSQSLLADDLRQDIGFLALELGPRNVWHESEYRIAADYIEHEFEMAGFAVARQTFEFKGRTCQNIEAEIRGDALPGEIVVIGAHYDTVKRSPGADDNASGVAALLAIARAMHSAHPQRTIRFVAFANEERPFDEIPGAMGSRVYAARCRERGENVTAMLAFDGLGFYRDAADSQHYPFPFNLLYPTTADFVGFVSDLDSRKLMRNCIGSFRRHARFPSQGVAAPRYFEDAGRSDHESFWNQGYRGVMVTDTLPFRYKHYHMPTDTSDKIDYPRLARVTEGLIAVAEDLAGVPDGAQQRNADR